MQIALFACDMQLPHEFPNGKYPSWDIKVCQHQGA